MRPHILFLPRSRYYIPLLRTTTRKRGDGGMIGCVVAAKETTGVEIAKYVHTLQVFPETHTFDDYQAGRTNPFE
jgi:hypothetical protein